MDFSVIISGYKEGALETLKACDLCEVESGRVEFIFADNTPDGRHQSGFQNWLDSRLDGLPKVTYLHVPKPGKTVAQNAAISEAVGRWIIFLDDDVVPDRLLFQAYRDAIKAFDVEAVQGRIDLHFTATETMPPWFCERFRTDLAEIAFAEPIYPYTYGLTGANMCIKRDAFSRYGLFDERFGPGKSGTLEDLEFSKRLQRNDRKELYWPKAVVTHQIPPERMTIKAFCRIYYDFGFSSYLLDEHAKDSDKRSYLRQALWSFRQIMKHTLLAIYNRILGRRSAFAIHRCMMSRNHGFMRHILQAKGSR